MCGAGGSCGPGRSWVGFEVLVTDLCPSPAGAAGTLSPRCKSTLEPGCSPRDELLGEMEKCRNGGMEKCRNGGMQKWRNAEMQKWILAVGGMAGHDGVRGLFHPVQSHDSRN